MGSQSNASEGKALIGIVTATVALALLYWGGSIVWFACSPAQPGSSAESVILIRKGQPPGEITRELESSGAIVDGRQFIFLGRLTRRWPKIKAGEYKVSPALAPIEIFDVLSSGVSIAHPVTIREGENMHEIAADLENKGLASKEQFLELCRSPALMKSLGIDAGAPNLEGYLFPETYFFNRTMSAEDMIRQMVGKFKSLWGEAETIRARELGMSRHRVITLASIVEKETGAVQERPLISSVFHNRLRKRMRLQSDPTTIYGIWSRYRGNLTRADLLDENPYNTYYIAGLPPGPISNPGKEAIQAALHPVRSEYLFFVSHNDGTHQFSETLEAHNSAVRKFQVDARARKGKSWRDLKKKKAGG